MLRNLDKTQLIMLRNKRHAETMKRVSLRPHPELPQTWQKMPAVMCLSFPS